MRSLVFCSMVLVLCGCDSRERALDIPISTSNGGGQFKVERVDVVIDDLAYRGRRGVYVITDTKTGQEFVGVSGIGISELGHHPIMVGRTTTFHQDER